MYQTHLTVLSSLKRGKASFEARISLIAKLWTLYMNDHRTQRGQVTATDTSGRVEQANKSEVAKKRSETR